MMYIAADKERCVILGTYIVENRATVRQTAARYGISKSTVHKDVTETLRHVNRALFEEVAKAEDLQDVFNTFYNLIYGTSTIKLVDEVFPDSDVQFHPRRRDRFQYSGYRRCAQRFFGAPPECKAPDGDLRQNDPAKER